MNCCHAARTFADWKAAAVEAGLQVNDKDRWRIKVGQDGDLEAFSHTNVVRAVFGTAGADFYGLWSGVAHQAAWALAEWSAFETAKEAQVTGLHVAMSIAAVLCAGLGVLALRWLPRDSSAEDVVSESDRVVDRA